MNAKQEAEVWQRVMAGTAPERFEAKTEQKLTAEQVMELLTQGRQHIHTYRTLWNRAPAAARQPIQELANAERSHGASLEAIYYLLTGEKPCKEQKMHPCTACISEMLRGCYHETVKTAEKCERLAACAGSFSKPLNILAQEKMEQAQRLLRILPLCLS